MMKLLMAFLVLLTLMKQKEIMMFTPIIISAMFYNMYYSNIWYKITMISKLNNYTMILTFLMIWTYIIIVIMTSNSSITMYTTVTSMVVFMFFTSYNIIYVYIYFEISLIPILMLIMGWGYQSERLSASLSMLFYTLSASLPLLLILINLKTNFLFLMMNMNIFVSSSEELLSLSLILAFLVKTPIYGLHLWLPKAHVEAPVQGSILLAAILLKLGCYGIFLVCTMKEFSFMYLVAFSLSALSLMIINSICSRIWDMKILIAYSSVAHMAVIIMMAILGSFNMPNIIMGIMITHAFSSSSLFAGANILYLRSNSRLMVMNQNTVNNAPTFILFWFITIMINMAAPPSFNLLMELLTIMKTIQFLKMLMILLSVSIMTTAIYSMIIFSTISQNKNKMMTMFFNISYQEILTMTCFSLPMMLTILVPSILNF